MKPIPLFGQGVGGSRMTITSQRRLNCYYDIRPDGDKSKIAVYGTPGLSVFSDVSQGPGRCARAMANLNLLFIVESGTLWEVNNAGVATSRGNVTVGTSIMSMSDNGIELLILDGVKGWIYNTNTHALTNIASGNFPQTAKTCTFNDGYFLVDDPSSPGRFRKSAAYDGTTWSSTDFGTAESNPDALLAVDEYHGIIPLFGSQSIEFWQDIGSSGFPYAPIKAATQDWGLVAIFSRTHVNNTIAFLGASDQGKPQVATLNGFNIQVISTPDIDTIIQGFSVLSDATGLTYMDGGHTFYQINFPTAMRSFLYDFMTQMWSEVQSGVGLTGRHRANIGVAFNNKNYVLDYSSGKIYLVDATVYTDNGTTIPRLLRTRHVFNDFNVLGIDELYLDIQTGMGLQSGQGSDPQIMLRVSKDNGRTYGIERWTSVGKVGQYSGPRAIWRRFGNSRDYVFEWSMTDPIPFVISSGAAVPRLGKG